jgi:hypothetical protein
VGLHLRNGRPACHFRYFLSLSQSATIFCTSDEIGRASSIAAFLRAVLTAGMNRTLSGGSACFGLLGAFTIVNISKLIARLRFLESDCRYHAAICDHKVERGEIMQRLAKAVPDCFDEAMTLLKFATSRAKSLKGLEDVSQPTIAMLKNAATGFFKAHVGLRMDNALERLHERRDHYVEEDA